MASLRLHKVTSLDAELFDFGVQGGAFEAEAGGGAIFSADLPKTRSGKIMRRLLRDIAEGRALGNVTTLADPSVIEALKEKYATTES